MKIKLICLLTISFFLYAERILAQEVEVLTIKQVALLARARSKEVSLAKGKVDKSNANREVVKNGQLPSIGGEASFVYVGNGYLADRDFTNGKSVTMPHLGNSVTVTAVQPLYTGGRIKNEIELAELAGKRAEVGFDKTLVDVSFVSVSLWLELYRLGNVKRVYEENIRQANMMIALMKGRHLSGVALKNDVTRYELNRARYETALLEIENSLSIINEKLTIFLDLKQRVKIEPDSTCIISLVDSLISGLCVLPDGSDAPDLRLVSLEKSMALKEIQLTKSSYMPQVSIVASNIFAGPILVEVPVIDKNFNYWFAGINIRYDFSSLYTTPKKLNLSKANFNISVLEDELVKDRLRVNISSINIRLNESIKALALHEKSLVLANDNYFTIKNNYLNGLSLITDLTDAGGIRLEAQLGIINAKLEILKNYYTLLKEAGEKL